MKGFLTIVQIARNLSIPIDEVRNAWLDDLVDKPNPKFKRPPAEYDNESREETINRILRTII